LNGKSVQAKSEYQNPKFKTNSKQIQNSNFKMTKTISLKSHSFEQFVFGHCIELIVKNRVFVKALFNAKNPVSTGNLPFVGRKPGLPGGVLIIGGGMLSMPWAFI
jgi:hypothetical protein